MEDVLFRWIGTLGFPIVSAVALAFALYKLGVYVATAHVKALETNGAEMKLQTAALTQIAKDLPNICKAGSGEACGFRRIPLNVQDNHQ